MIAIPTATVRVPATTANLGPGFDCLGAALTLYNEFSLSRLPSSRIEPFEIYVTGVNADQVKTNETNLAYQAFVRLCQQAKQAPPPVRIDIRLNVPLARGLGSSATAIVGGLVGANALLGDPFSQDEVMQLAIALEGHPDNVVPALIGGCRLAATADGGWAVCDIPWNGTLVPVVVIPDFELSTAEARRVLPASYSRADAIFNIAHLGLLLRGLETGREDWLKAALDDRIHQPYRQSLIPGYDAVREAAIATGAYGLVISGAGPTLLALTHTSQASEVRRSMELAWQEQGIRSQSYVLHLDPQGATIERNP